jgi:hypothetical protein
MLKYGMLVLTPDGMGTVKGFERFTSSGHSAPLATEDIPGSSSRVAIELENNPYTFSPVYYFRGQIDASSA